MQGQCKGVTIHTNPEHKVCNPQLKQQQQNTAANSSIQSVSKVMNMRGTPNDIASYTPNMFDEIGDMVIVSAKGSAAQGT